MMDSPKHNRNERLAKNTLLLYFRMLFVMFVGLYVSRIVLQELGESDFGVYNVVGGFVAMFAIISSSLSSAISRYITFELGKGDGGRLREVFSMSVNIQLIIGLFILVIGEIAGLWFIENKMSIDETRRNVAVVVFQFSLLTFLVNLISVPYNACVIAHEKMKFFAYIGVVEVFLKLFAVFILKYVCFDKLELWALLLMLIAVVLRLVYGIYCRKNFKECRYKFNINQDLLKEMFGFAGWNFIGEIAGVLRNHGVNVLLNVYFGPVVNAGRGIANQVSHAVNQFSRNFMIAVSPQITKLYAKEEIASSYNLALMSSRLSGCLLLIVSLPLVMEMDFVLHLWLGPYPQAALNFSILSIILVAVESIALPFVTLQRATGKMKKYQLVVGTVHLLNFPISFLLLAGSFRADYVYYVAIFLAIVCLFCRVALLKDNMPISMAPFFKDVCLRLLLVVSACVTMCYIVKQYISIPPIGSMLLIVLFSTILVVLLGMKKSEIIFLKNKIRGK